MEQLCSYCKTPLPFDEEFTSDYACCTGMQLKYAIEERDIAIQEVIASTACITKMDTELTRIKKELVPKLTKLKRFEDAYVHLLTEMARVEMVVHGRVTASFGGRLNLITGIVKLAMDKYPEIAVATARKSTIE